MGGNGRRIAGRVAEARLEDFVYIAGRIGWRGLKAEEYTESGPLFLSVHSLNKGEYVDFTVAKHISQDRYDESPEIKLREDDILLAKDGDFLVARGNGSLKLVGRGGLVTEEPDDVAYPDTLIRVRPDEQRLSRWYLAIAWDSPTVRDQIEGAAHTTAGIHKVSQQDLAVMTVPLPPLAEQQEIVHRVDALFALADKIEARVAAGDDAGGKDHAGDSGQGVSRRVGADRGGTNPRGRPRLRTRQRAAGTHPGGARKERWGRNEAQETTSSQDS